MSKYEIRGYAVVVIINVVLACMALAIVAERMGL